MRKGWLFIFICAFISMQSCLKKDAGCSYRIETKSATSAEEQALIAYLNANSISASRDSSKMYYQIINPGTGASPALCSNILVKYSGKFATGAVFDSQENSVLVLGTLIDGWKIGVPLIKKGGQIRLYIPPSLGYGSSDVRDNQGRVVIPANSILIFDITLLDLQ